MIILAHEGTRNDSVNLTTSICTSQACFLSSLSLAMGADPKTMYQQCHNFGGKFLSLFLATLFICSHKDENLKRNLGKVLVQNTEQFLFQTCNPDSAVHSFADINNQTVAFFFV